MTRSLKMTGSSLSAAALPALCVVAAIAVAQDEETGADTGVEKAPPAGTRVEAEAEDAPSPTVIRSARRTIPSRSR